jgi:hypothetical protein
LPGRGILQDAQFGDVISVGMGGEDGLTPTGTPVIAGTYSFPETAYVPLELLPGTMACVVGLPTPDADVRLRVGPGDQRGELGTLRANMSYAVLGWANDPEGAAWWELDTGAQSSWARQAEVRAIGACDAVAQVEPPPVVVAPPGSQPPAGDTGAASGSDLAPTANSVWQMRPGSDNLSGECSGAPAINFCDHLAAIAPAEGGISWKGMEASPYILGRTRPNVYYYAGPNVLGTGTLTMTLTFSSPTELNMIMTLVLNSEPDCQHTYYYSGTRNW